jgi:integrase
MRAKLTNAWLAKLVPQRTRFEVHDDGLPGFSARVSPDGSVVYYARYRLPDGRQVRMKLGSGSVLTPAQARDLAKEALADAVKGVDPAEKRRLAHAHTLKTFLEQEYEPWLAANRKAGAYMAQRIRVGCESFLGKRLVEISPWLVEKWRVKFAKNHGAVNANRVLAYLKACLGRAVEWGHLKENLLHKVKKFKEDPHPRVRFLSSDEEQGLMRALDDREDNMRRERDSHNAWCRERNREAWPDLRAGAYADHLKPMVLVSLNTGLRRGELFSLEWRDIDLDKKILTIRGAKAKSGVTRHVPLNTAVLETLQTWRRQTLVNGLAFPSKDGKRFDNCNSAWEKVLEQANISDFHWHDMRHTFASKLVMAGVDLNTVRELLGHSDIKMTLRYSHLAPEHKARAVEKITFQSSDNIVPLPVAESRNA